MTPRKKFYKLHKSSYCRLDKIRRLASIAVRSPDVDRERLMGYVAIETLNTWSNFLRAYYLSCTIDCKTITGVRIRSTSRVSSFNEAIGLAIVCIYSRRTPNALGFWSRRDEPSWHDLNNFLKICQNLGVSNINDIRSALSTGSLVYTHLPIIRNFYAHRNEDSARKVMNVAPSYGISATFKPTKILSSNSLGRPQPLILDLIDDLLTTIGLMCE